MEKGLCSLVFPLQIAWDVRLFSVEIEGVGEIENVDIYKGVMLSTLKEMQLDVTILILVINTMQGPLQVLDTLHCTYQGKSGLLIVGATLLNYVLSLHRCLLRLLLGCLVLMTIGIIGRMFLLGAS